MTLFINYEKYIQLIESRLIESPNDEKLWSQLAFWNKKQMDYLKAVNSKY